VENSRRPSVKRKPSFEHIDIRVVIQNTNLTRHKHIKCVSHKLTDYQNKPSIVNSANLISLTGSDPAKSLFNDNVFVNALFSDFISNYIKVIGSPGRTQPRDLPRNINFHNLYVKVSLYDEQTVDFSLSMCCLDVPFFY